MEDFKLSSVFVSAIVSQIGNSQYLNASLLSENSFSVWQQFYPSMILRSAHSEILRVFVLLLCDYQCLLFDKRRQIKLSILLYYLPRVDHFLCNKCYEIKSQKELIIFEMRKRQWTREKFFRKKSCLFL